MGWYHIPKLASVRYMGSLALEETVEELLAEAREKYAAGERRIDATEGGEEMECMEEMYRMIWEYYNGGEMVRVEAGGEGGRGTGDNIE
jgi:hypothetical protein